MTERVSWPPMFLAVLKDGNNNPAYYRPIEPGESLKTFIDRIARTVVHEAVEFPYTAFVEVIAGHNGEADEALTVLVQESMERQRL